MSVDSDQSCTYYVTQCAGEGAQHRVTLRYVQEVLAIVTYKHILALNSTDVPHALNVSFNRE